MLPGDPNIHMQLLALLVQKHRDNPRAVLPLAAFDDLRHRAKLVLLGVWHVVWGNRAELKAQIKALHTANKALKVQIVELEQRLNATLAPPP